MVNITSKRKQEINKEIKIKNKVNNKRDMKRTKAPCSDLSPRITMVSPSHKS